MCYGRGKAKWEATYEVPLPTWEIIESIVSIEHTDP